MEPIRSWTTSGTYLHHVGLGAGSRTLRLADEVGLRVGAAQTLVSGPQAAVAVRSGKTRTVTLVPCEVSRRGGGEDDELGPALPPAAVLQTPCVVYI